MADPPAVAADEALAHARAIAADWRDAGLQVGLVEHASQDGRPGGCDLIARSPSRVLRCACRPAASRDGRPLWAVEVSVGRCDDDPDGIERVRLRTVGTAVAEACGPAWRQVLDWVHGEETPPRVPPLEPVPAGRWRGWAAIARRLGAPDVAGIAGRLEGAASRLRRRATAACQGGLARLAAVGRGRSRPHASGGRPSRDLAALAGRLGRAVPLPDWRDVTEPLLKGGLLCLAGAVIAVVGVCVAGWRFAAQDERAYHAYARMCAAALHDGAAAEDEFWCKRARQLRLLYRFAEDGGGAAR